MTENKIDKLRTRLRDFLFGRPRIHLVSDSRSNKLEHEPVFIVGTFRSVTTLLRYLLDSHPNIACPPETKFLSHLADMHGKESTMSAFDSMGFDADFVRGRIRDFVDQFYFFYLQANNKSRIIDKTPDYVRILDFIEWIYRGRCRYIVIFRNGLDVAQSMNTVHVEPLEPDKSLRSAFNYWRHDTNIMLDWLERHPQRCYKITYEQLCSDIRQHIGDILAFIDESWDEGIMTWYDKRHDRGQEDIRARRQRKINKSTGTYECWDPQMIKQFKSDSAALHSRIGYDPETLKMD